MNAKKRSVYVTTLFLAREHMEGRDPLDGAADPDAEIEQLEDRVARAVAALGALRRGLEIHSFTSEDPRERVLLMSTLRSAEAAHDEWVRLGGGATATEERLWVERLMDYAFTEQQVDASNFSASVWGLSLRKDSSKRDFELAAAEVRRALLSHSPRFRKLAVAEVERALRDWDVGERKPGRPRGAVRSRTRIVHDVMVAAGITKPDTMVSSSGRAARRARKKK